MKALFYLLILCTAWGQGPDLKNAFRLSDAQNPLKITNVTSSGNAAPGEFIPVTLTLSLPAGFHAYEERLKIFNLAPDGTRISGVQLKPSREFIDYAKKKHMGLTDSGNLNFVAELPKDLENSAHEMQFELEYIACSEKFCLPPNKIGFAVPFKNRGTAAAPTTYIENKIEDNFLLALLFVFGFGLLTSLTPCVYPLIPITLAVIGARGAKGGKGQAFLLSLVYVLGIAFTYSILGVIAAQTGALFGQALSYPPVVIAFSILFIAMAFSLYGYFEITPPAFITDKLSRQKTSAGFIGTFITGLIAGVIASPCVGPVLVGILAYIAKTQSTVLGFSLLFTFAMGMGVLFLVLGTFSSLFNKLPRSGKWMETIKFLLGTAMVGVAFYYIKPVLGPKALAVAAAICILIPFYDLLRKVRKPFRSTAINYALFFVPVAAATFAVAMRLNSPMNSSNLKLVNGWQAYSNELVEEAKADGKPVIIDFFAEWCAACVELDEKTFSQQSFIDKSKEFVLLKVDATENFPGLSELQTKYSVFGLPTIVFISKKGEILQDLSLTGFEEVDGVLQRMQDTLKK